MKIKALLSCFLLMISISSQANFPAPTLHKSESNYAQTKYPVVFVHGMMGFNRLGPGFIGLDYWHRILPDLAKHSGNVSDNIWPTRVSPFNSTERRGEELIKQIDQILAITQAEKVNLVGHSHGGPTIRYAANHYLKENRVASMTAIAAPNKGSQIADTIIAKGNKIPLLNTIISKFLNFFSNVIIYAQGEATSDYKHDPLASLYAVSVAGSTEFSKTHTIGMPTSACDDGPLLDQGIYNYSFTGIKPFTNIFDIDSYLLLASSAFVHDGANDGLVSRCSAKFGKTIRDNYGWNHFDEVNQIFGLVGWFQADPVQVYRQHLNRLKVQGL